MSAKAKNNTNIALSFFAFLIVWGGWLYFFNELPRMTPQAFDAMYLYGANVLLGILSLCTLMVGSVFSIIGLNGLRARDRGEGAKHHLLTCVAIGIFVLFFILIPALFWQDAFHAVLGAVHSTLLLLSQ